jgi:hypothetical protein
MEAESLVTEAAPPRSKWQARALVALSGLLFLLPGALFPWAVMGPLAQRFEEANLRFLAFGLLAAAGAGIYRAVFRRRSWGEALLAAPLAYALIHKLAVFIPAVSTYPFSMGWSEASRYYYASLFFAQKVYGEAAPLSVLHPSRYLMQSLPFLVDGTPLWVHRFWQAALWIAFNLLVGWALSRRLGWTGRIPQILFSAWAFLFFFQGPIYYHLLVMPLVVLLTFDARRPWRTAAFVLLASAWGGISRVNWIPFPGALAAMLYLLEVPQEKKVFWRYLALPAAWFVSGSLTGLLTQKLYETFSGNPAAYFGTSFSSDLLWYRLLPSETYPMGVLKATLLASLPAVLLLLYLLVRTWRGYRPWRLLGLAGVLAVFLGGGILVSVKIGGGSNLHNMDAYLLLLAVVMGYWLSGAFRPDQPHPKIQPILAWGLAAFVVLLPLYFILPEGGPAPRRDLPAAQAALETLRQQVNQAAAQGGEILFISERHLLALGVFDQVGHVPEYEKVFLMEMAMASHQPYLQAFRGDLQSRRFTLIVSEPLRINYQGRDRQFGEENDAWVRGVSEPVLCYYIPTLALEEYGIQLYAPAAEDLCP